MVVYSELAFGTEKELNSISLPAVLVGDNDFKESIQPVGFPVSSPVAEVEDAFFVCFPELLWGPVYLLMQSIAIHIMMCARSSTGHQVPSKSS